MRFTEKSGIERIMNNLSQNPLKEKEKQAEIQGNSQISLNEMNQMAKEIHADLHKKTHFQAVSAIFNGQSSLLKFTKSDSDNKQDMEDTLSQLQRQVASKEAENRRKKGAGLRTPSISSSMQTSSKPSPHKAIPSMHLPLDGNTLQTAAHESLRNDSQSRLIGETGILQNPNSRSSSMPKIHNTVRFHFKQPYQHSSFDPDDLPFKNKKGGPDNMYTLAKDVRILFFLFFYFVFLFLGF